MNDFDIEIVDNTNNNDINNNPVDNNTSTDFVVQQENTITNDIQNQIDDIKQPLLDEKIPVPDIEDLTKTVTIDTIPKDKKEAKRLAKERAKQAKLEKKLKKKNKNNETQENVTSNVAEQNKVVNIVETAVTTGSSGSQTIGNISNGQITANNSPLPSPIDITIKQKVDPKDKTKKVKVVTKADKVISILAKIFVVIVIGLMIFAGYYFGYKTNPSLYSVKNLTFELGEDIPSTVSHYINKQNQADDMEYVLDLSNVSKDITGTYKYSVKHNNVVKNGQITIRDTKPPVITIKDNNKLKFSKNSKITKEEIVESCEDLSNCTYNLEYEIDTEEAGEKEAKIRARDDAGNEAEFSTKVLIIDIATTLTCTSEKINSDDNLYYTQIVDTLDFDSNNNLVQSRGVRKYSYTDAFGFYNKLKDIENNEKYTIDKETKSYSEENKVNTNNLTSLKDVRNYYVENGFTCK